MLSGYQFSIIWLLVLSSLLFLYKSGVIYQNYAYHARTEVIRRMEKFVFYLKRQ